MGGLAATFAVGFLAMGGPAAADGPCGANPDGNHACPVNSASTPTYAGSLVTDNESDYYVLYAQKNTELNVTITDTENPQCPNQCGNAGVNLLDAQGNGTYQGASSAPNSGITVPGTFAYTIGATGTYYLVVGGNLGRDANGNPTSVPYTLSVSAAPSVQWPPPAPPPPPGCMVPRFRVGAWAGTVERRVLAAHCSIARVRFRYARRIGRGRVLAVSPRPGSALGYRAPVTITVSAGKHPRRHHRRRG